MEASSEVLLPILLIHLIMGRGLNLREISSDTAVICSVFAPAGLVVGMSCLSSELGKQNINQQ